MTDPTDLELMMYADGELDPERAAEVARYLEADAGVDASSKLFGLSVLSAHVQREADRVATAHRADDIVASVFDAIRAEQTNGASAKASGRSRVADVIALRRSEGGRSEGGHDHDHDHDHDHGSIEAPAKSTTLDRKRLDRKRVVSTDKPANDNARLIFGLAGVAAAAAIALGIWGKGAPPVSGPAGVDAKVAVVEAPTDEPVARNTTPAQIESNKKAPPPVQDDTPAVAVASVDFGTKTGAVYYVPSDSAGPTTTVVWVSE